jgi:hypothetical protein
MNGIFRYTIIAVICGLFMTQSFANAQDKTTPPTAGKPQKADKTDKTENTEKTPKGLAPVTLEDLAVNFPEVEGWNTSEIQKYPTEDLGFSVNYESRTGGKVTIYVYNAGKKNIPNDVADKVVKEEFNKVKAEIKAVAEMGVYENLKEIKNDTVTLGETSGKIKALHALYNFSVKGQNLTSEIYIFGHENRFIKIRATRPRDKNESGDKLVTELLKEIDAYFSKSFQL